MPRLIALLFLSLQLSISFAETSSRADAAKEFAHCYLLYSFTALAAPKSDEFVARADAYRKKAEEYGRISVILTNRAFFDAEVEVANQKITSILAGDNSVTSAGLEQFRKLCEELPLKHAGILIELMKELGKDAADKAAAELSPFDYEKTKSLPPQKRREYDLVFFNEIETWNLNSNRYGADSSIARKAEFQKMAADGYLPAYVALRLVGIFPATERYDPEALDMLLKEAERGDPSAMCAILAIPMKRENWRQMDLPSIASKYELEGVMKGHGACMAYYGGALLLGNSPRLKQDRNAAMPLLLESARQGYYVAARRLFSVRLLKALQKSFDFTNSAELERAICWGRLAQQHTNWAGLETFLGLLRDYARANGRTDLMEQSYRLDPRRVPITDRVIKPEDCISLELAE